MMTGGTPILGNPHFTKFKWFYLDLLDNHDHVVTVAYNYLMRPLLSFYRASTLRSPHDHAQDIQKKAADFLQTQLPEMTAQIVSSLESLSFQVGDVR